MTDLEDDIELVRGSGNVFADFGAPDAELHQFKAVLAAEIIKALDAHALSVREAEKPPASPPPSSLASGRPNWNASPWTA